MDIAMPGTLLNVIENFLDATHTHFVHADLIRTDSRRAKSRVAITLSNDRVEAAYTDEAPQTGLISRLFEGTRQSSSGRFILPGVAEIEIRSPQGTEFAMTAYVTPVTDTSQRAQVILALPSRGIIPGRLRHAILGPFLQAAIAQDRKILDLQQRNIARFGEERFHSTEVDLLRPYIRSLLQNGPAAAPSHREVILEL
jgi:phenylpropionate dioxygenase-like ring-hydroxylating dioxygenase large terminal subunit